MRTLAAFLCLLLSASLAHAQAVPAAKPAPGKAAPAAPAQKDAKKEAPLPKIPGTVITRANGNFLSLQVVSGNFVLSFYDKKHKPMPIDVTRAAARWPNPRAPGDNRTMLNGSGTALVGAKPVLPPHNFNVFLTLLKGEGEAAQAVETYTVQFRG